MCELLALSSSHPEHLTFSLHTLAARGGQGMSARDGWGAAFYQGVDVGLFREPFAAGDSELVRYLESSGPSTQLAISDIRHAPHAERSRSPTPNPSRVNSAVECTCSRTTATCLASTTAPC